MPYINALPTFFPSLPPYLEEALDEGMAAADAADLRNVV